MWGEDYINAEVQGYIEFDAKNGGEFQFGYVQGVTLSWIIFVVAIPRPFDGWHAIPIFASSCCTRRRAQRNPRGPEAVALDVVCS